MVRKASGEMEPFSEAKVVSSIKRAGIPNALQSQVLKHVKEITYDQISTSEIYHHIIEFLSQSEHPYVAAKYSLKQSLMDLGPTGYPFEDYFAEILRFEGYNVKIRQIIKGQAINHEIDILAEKNQQKSMIECKFHNNAGLKTDAQVILAVHSRFLDICQTSHCLTAWLVTNTKVTSDVISYAKFYKIKIIAWDYPSIGNLRSLVDHSSLFPVTALRSLSSGQKQVLLENHLVLCRDLLAKPDLLSLLSLSPDFKEKVLAEVHSLLQKKP